MDTFVIVVGIVLAIILLFILFRILRSTTHVIPQEERWVIYRLGRFRRLAGPGTVQIIPQLDEIKRVVNVRDRPHEVTVKGVFAFGVPNDLTLNLWCSFDLEKAAGEDRNKLAQLVQINELERREQVEVKMREALIRQISTLQERMPLPDKAQFMDRVIALAPGSTRYNALLRGVQYELERSLPSIGVILDTSQPIVLTKRGLSDEIVEAIKRRRGREIDSEWLTNYVDQLRQRFPGIDNSVIAQMLASIEGVDVGRVQRLLLEQEPGTEAEVEFEMPADGITSAPNVITKPKKKPGHSTPRRQTASQEPEREPALPPSESLAKDDLAVLKRVPSSPDNDEKMIA